MLVIELRHSLQFIALCKSKELHMDFQVLLVIISSTTYTALGKGNVPMGEAPSNVINVAADRFDCEERTTSNGGGRVTTSHRSIHPSTT